MQKSMSGTMKAKRKRVRKRILMSIWWIWSPLALVTSATIL
jgi:hypothetical protein